MVSYMVLQPFMVEKDRKGHKEYVYIQNLKGWEHEWQDSLVVRTYCGDQ